MQNKIYIKDRNGNETHRKYNEKSFLLEEALPNGLIINYEYDKEDNLIRRWDNSGREQLFRYDTNHNIIHTTFPIEGTKQFTISYEYDEQGRVKSITNPNGNKNEYHYKEKMHKPVSYQSSEGNIFDYTYDQAGRNLSVTSELGTATFTYNELNYCTLMEDANGNKTRFFYDKMCNLIKHVKPNQYNTETGDGAGTKYTYDSFDNLLLQIDPLDNIFATLRDIKGNMVKEVNPNYYDNTSKDGIGIQHIYDSDNRRTKTIYPDGGVEQIQYDYNGNITKRISPLMYEKEQEEATGYTYEYDNMNQLVQVTAPNGTVLKRYIYNQIGNIIKEIDAKGYLTAETDEERIGTLYYYNTIGWLKEKRVPIKVEDEGTSNKEISNKEISNKGVKYQLTQYKYDLAGNITKEIHYYEEQTKESMNGKKHYIDFHYDKEERLIQVRDQTGAVEQYRYNSLNQVIYEERKINETTKQYTSYTYGDVIIGLS